MENQTFEEFLKDVHAKNYNGTDDDMSDAFEEWLENIGIDYVIQFATNFGNLKFLDGKKAGLDKAEEIFLTK